MENIDVIKPQPRTLDRVHGEYASLTEEQRRDRAYNKLQEFIDAGRPAAARAVERIMTEVPEDRLVRAAAMHFQTVRIADSEEDAALRMSAGGAVFGVHPNALRQLGERAGMPHKYIRGLMASDWGRRLVARNLDDLYTHQPEEEQRLLVRAVGSEVRGVVSWSYGLDDSRPAVDALIGVGQEVGAVIVGGVALDVRASVKMMVDKPVEMFPGEWAVVGLDYRTSDYGCGARELCGWILRLLCLNGATTVASFRKVHLGARMTDEVEFTERTRRLRAEATASATRDMARALLGPQAVAKMVERVRAANAEALDPDEAIKSIRKDVNKEEQKAIVDKFNSPDVELLPPGQTKWRFSNAISWLATQTKDADRRLDLEKVAGEVLDTVKVAA